jgi:phage terminase large subunit-like protein
VSRYDAAWHGRLRSIIADLPFRTQTERIEIRKALAADPVAFAILYLSHHLKDSTGRVTFSEVHYEWARIAESWRGADEPQANRNAFVAPRETGKSTWWFLVLPLWAAANHVRRFAVAFAHADSQATGHLATFKRELDTNTLLRADFPDLCEPARKQTGTTLADRQGMLHTSDGFVFAARGVDTASLGLKVGEVRPDLLVFDDIEPDEARYSPDLAKKRLGTIQDALLPLNIRAAVVMVGTVTMPGSIMHQLVRVAHGAEDEELKWIRDEKIVPHHHVPILADDEGTERSMWPEKWPLPWLLSIRHTRSYAKNYANDPMGRDGDYWTSDDFTYATLGAEATRWVLQLDPAVTTKGTSDYTGWAIVAYRPPRRVSDSIHATTKPVAEVVAAGKVRLVGEALRTWVLRMLSQHERIKAVRVEVNQGGDLWYTVLHSLPAKLLVHTSNESKEVRFAYALDLYQRGHVLHRERLREAEEQMISFPKAPYDDIADAVVCAVLFFLADVPRVASTVTSSSYV